MKVKTDVYSPSDIYLCPNCGTRPVIRARVTDMVNCIGKMRVECDHCGRHGYDYTFCDIGSLADSTVRYIVKDWNNKPMWRDE